MQNSTRVTIVTLILVVFIVPKPMPLVLVPPQVRRVAQEQLGPLRTEEIPGSILAVNAAGALARSLSASGTAVTRIDRSGRQRTCS